MDTKYVLLGLVALVAVGAASFYLGNKSPDIANIVGSIPGINATTTPDTAADTGPIVSAKPAGGTTSSTAPKVGAAGTGRVVFTFVDETAPIDTYQSVLLTISDVAVQHPSLGWMSVLKGSRQFELVTLRQKGIESLFADVGLSPGTYTNVRFTADKVTVIQKNGLPTIDAFIPSARLTFPIKLLVVKGKTSAVTLTSFSGKALRPVKGGSLIYFPVVGVTTQHDIRGVQTIGLNTELFNGLADSDQAWGMDENRMLKTGFSFLTAIQFELLAGKVIRVIPMNEKTSDIKIPAQDAVAATLAGKYIDTALSVQTTARQNKQVWQVAGTKGGPLVKVFLDIGTGALIAVE